MKRLGLSLITALSAAFISTTASANITVFTFGGEETCNSLAGNWEGKGTVIAYLDKDKKIKITCEYNGKMVATSTGPGAYNLHADLSETKGICPKSESFDIGGTCENGKITLKTDNADLSGDLSADGKSATMSGSVSVDVAGKKINADIRDLSIHKKN